MSRRVCSNYTNPTKVFTPYILILLYPSKHSSTDRIQKMCHHRVHLVLHRYGRRRAWEEIANTAT